MSQIMQISGLLTVGKTEQAAPALSPSAAVTEDLLTAETKGGPIIGQGLQAFWGAGEQPVKVHVGDKVSLQVIAITNIAIQQGSFSIMLDSPFTFEIARINAALKDGRLAADWQIALPANLPAAARFYFIFNSEDDAIFSGNKLEIYDQLEATIVDADGNPLKNAEWQATLSDGSLSYSGKTDDLGKIYYNEVLAGKYSLILPGYILINDDLTRMDIVKNSELTPVTAKKQEDPLVFCMIAAGKAVNIAESQPVNEAN